MSQTWKAPHAWAAVAAVALAMLVAACGGGDDDDGAATGGDSAGGDTTGVTDDTVKVGFFSVMSGPVSLSGTSAWDGLRLYIEEVNSNGGVHGRQIELVGPYDEACEASQAVSSVRRLISQDEVFAIFGGGCSGASLAILPTLEETGVPMMISVSTSPEFFADPMPNLFRAGTVSDGIQAEAITDAAVEQFDTKRPAILAVSNEYGQGAAVRIAERLEGEHGIETVATESYEVGATDFNSQLLAIRRADPDAVFVYAYHQEAGRIVRQAKNLGLEAPMIGGSATSTPLFADAAGQAAEGFIALHPVPVLTESDEAPEMVEYREKLTELHDGELPAGRPSDYDLYSWGAAQAFVQGLENAGRELTRESFIAGLEQIDDLRSGLTFPVDFSESEHDGSRDAMLVTYNADGSRELLDYRWSESQGE